jgi:hypothetical protein
MKEKKKQQTTLYYTKGGSKNPFVVKEERNLPNNAIWMGIKNHVS